jgi:hypothetical protein
MLAYAVLDADRVIEALERGDPSWAAMDWLERSGRCRAPGMLRIVIVPFPSLIAPKNPLRRVVPSHGRVFPAAFRRLHSFELLPETP